MQKYGLMEVKSTYSHEQVGGYHVRKKKGRGYDKVDEALPEPGGSCGRGGGAGEG